MGDVKKENGLDSKTRSRSRSPARKRDDRKPRDDSRRDSRDRGRSDRSRRDGGSGINYDRRVYVSNIPYDMKWQDIKDLFREKVGEVTFVELIESRGCGVVEFTDRDVAQKAIDEMHRHEVRGRKLVVKPDREVYHDNSRRGRGDGMGSGGGGGGGMQMNDMGMNMGIAAGNLGLGLGLGGLGGGGNLGMGGGLGLGMGGSGGGGGGLGFGGGNIGGMGLGQTMGTGGGSGIGSGRSGVSNMNMYGIDPQILQRLGIELPLTCKVFVANLDYKVTEKKVREIFELAGKVLSVDLKTDQDGKSKGIALVEYEHPVEAVQAISMLKGQLLFGRTITIRMDRLSDKPELPKRLPAGLSGIGAGLGLHGNRITNVKEMAQGGPVDAPANISGGSSSGLGMGGSGGSLGGMGLGGTSMGMGMDMANLGGGGAGVAGGGLGSLGGGMSGNLGVATSAGLGSNALSGLGSSLGGLGDLSNLGSNTGLTGQGLTSGSLGGGGLSGLGNLSGIAGLGSGLGGNLGNLSGMGLGTGLGSAGLNMSQQSGMGDFSMRDRLGRDRDRGMDRRDRDGMDRGGSDNTVFIRNLPFSVTWQMLKERLREVADVKYIEMKSKGCATVSFFSREDADRVINLMNGVRIDGRQIEVRFDRYN